MATYEMKQDQDQEDKKTGLVTKIATGAIVAGVTALPMVANAASLDFTGASAELEGAQTAIVGIIGVLIVIGGIVLGWNTFRRSAH